jgi:PAS domain S-box-containing protein
MTNSDESGAERRRAALAQKNRSAASGARQRQRAEARLRERALHFPEESPALTPEECRHLLHELRVHQIELEMQNEELRESETALEAARERYFDLYDLAPVGYCTVDERGMIRQSNLNAAKLLGVTRGTLIGQPFARRIVREDQDVYYLHRKQLTENGMPCSFELRMKKEDGTVFWIDLTITIGRDSKGAVEFRAILSDIDERKRVEVERTSLQRDLQDKNMELERARLAADKANQAKSDFLSNMSHELRTPLHAILGFTQLLESGPPPPTLNQEQSIDQILKAGWHLLDLIEEILDLAVIEAGKIILTMEAVSLPELIQECETMVLPMAQRYDIGLVFPAAQVTLAVLADRMRIKQVLINLLSNAIKYNRAGGTVTVSSGKVSATRIRIRVQDNGAGLAPEKLGQLFQPFNRLGQEAGSTSGTGIGLVVCKRLIELMGGTIGVESEVGRGSIFWVELDLGAPQATLVGEGESLL